jgi:hypothetical protein
MPLFLNGALPPGFMDLTFPDFRAEFGFSPKRQMILDHVENYLGLCLWRAHSTEVWLDGSFVEENPDPNDLDLVFFYDPGALDPPSQREILELTSSSGYVRASIKAQYYVDVLVCRAGDLNGLMYWRGVFGFKRDNTPKGVIRLIL